MDGGGRIEGNKSLFYWLLCNLKSPLRVTIVRQGVGELTSTPRNIFKVFRLNKAFMYQRIYKKEAHAGEFKLYVQER